MNIFTFSHAFFIRQENGNSLNLFVQRTSVCYPSRLPDVSFSHIRLKCYAKLISAMFFHNYLA